MRKRRTIQKLTLDELQVKSFITHVNNMEALKAGAETGDSDDRTNSGVRTTLASTETQSGG